MQMVLCSLVVTLDIMACFELDNSLKNILSLLKGNVYSTLRLGWGRKENIFQIHYSQERPVMILVQF